MARDSTTVLAVAARTLNLGGGTYASESAWSGSGGGYSPTSTNQAYQRSVQTTGRRANPDVTYDANPNTGFSVYDNAVGGRAAGTKSAAPAPARRNGPRSSRSPIRAAQANAGAPLSTALQAVYSLAAGDFHDITIGSNGYRAGTGYDAVTGRGSPFANAVIRDLVAFGAATTTASTHSTTPPPAAGPTSGPRMQKADEMVGELRAIHRVVELFLDSG